MTPPNPSKPVAQERVVDALRGPFGGLIARPWFDKAALGTLSRLFFPLSRLWAAALSAEGSTERFLNAIPLEEGKFKRTKLEKILSAFESCRIAAVDADQRWDDGFFGTDDQTMDQLTQLEADRIDGRHALNNQRRRLLRLRVGRDIPSIAWRIPSPEDAKAIESILGQEEGSLFAPPMPMPEVERSRSIVIDGVRQYWLRFPSPDRQMGDHVIARVQEPADTDAPATIIYGHGICVEFDHWRGMLDEARTLVNLGIRVVRPEAPGHGRRVPTGHYGGERLIATAPLGGLFHFIAAIREWSVLMDWARDTSGAPVAVGGTSLGSMTAQLVAHKSRTWPERLQPDAMFLVTHCGQLHEAVRDGAFAKIWKTEEAMADAGWSLEQIAACTRPLYLNDVPVMEPENIVSVLGTKDTVTPYAGARKYLERLAVPAENIFESRRGHFSVPISLLRDHRAQNRFRDILQAIA